ncbi:MAG TPA: LysR substrate-binding domain-containing protein, partial [Paraburkholderia sp.]|nr:LysR substrate-binding domain-containing protein [Paraburkholderia sp.]
TVLKEVPRMTAAINFVAAGSGITVVPASMQRYGQHGVVYLPFGRGLRLSAPLHLAYREQEPNSAAQRFVQLVQGQRAGSKARV